MATFLLTILHGMQMFRIMLFTTFPLHSIHRSAFGTAETSMSIPPKYPADGGGGGGSSYGGGCEVGTFLTLQGFRICQSIFVKSPILVPVLVLVLALVTSDSSWL